MAMNDPDLQVIARHLRAEGQFGPLSTAQLMTLLAESPRLTAGPGEILLREDDETRDHLLLLSGKLEAQRVWSNHGAYDQSYTWELDPAHSAAGFSLLAASSRVRVRALSPVVFLQIGADRVDDLIGWNQQFAMATGTDPEWQRRMRLIKEIGVFHHVPLENIVTAFGRMQPVPVDARATVVKQGDEGDSYYLIDAGEAEVIRTDPMTDETARVGLLGPGDAFGEEALLQDGYRNATVTMLTPGRLLRLDKADFEELLRPSVVREVSPEQALAMIKEQAAVWLDCRYDTEYEESRIPGTLLAPLDQIRGDVIKLDPDKTYVVYCRSVRRSKAAAFLLRERHINAVSLQGGIKSWPYEVDTSPPA